MTSHYFQHFACQTLFTWPHRYMLVFMYVCTYVCMYFYQPKCLCISHLLSYCPVQVPGPLFLKCVFFLKKCMFKKKCLEQIHGLCFYMEKIALVFRSLKEIALFFFQIDVRSVLQLHITHHRFTRKILCFLFKSQCFYGIYPFFWAFQTNE